MKRTFYKTQHFWQRAWERGLHQTQIDKLISDINPPKGKSIAVFGRERLKKAGIKLPNSSHLIIVMKGKVLLTVFTVPNLFYYLKNISRTNNILTF